MSDSTNECHRLVFKCSQFNAYLLLQIAMFLLSIRYWTYGLLLYFQVLAFFNSLIFAWMGIRYPSAELFE